MDVGVIRFTNLVPTGVIAILAVAVAGCWEEIVYTGPAPTTAARRAPTSSSPSDIQPAAPTPNALPEVEPVENPPTTTNELTKEAVEPVDDLPFGDFADAEPEVEAQPPQDVEADEPADSLFDPPEEAPPAAEAHATRYAAWQLGSKLSLAALAHDRSLVPESVSDWFRESQAAAELLGTSIDELPERQAMTEGEAAPHGVHNYLYQQGQRVWRDLSDRHGADHAALFEMAVKSNALQVLYTPGSSDTEAIASGIVAAGSQSDLPQELWQPLLDVIAKQAPDAEVRAAVRKLHADVEEHLSAAKEPSL
jgi:hypothetical protein